MLASQPLSKPSLGTLALEGWRAVGWILLCGCKMKSKLSIAHPLMANTLRACHPVPTWAVPECDPSGRPGTWSRSPAWPGGGNRYSVLMNVWVLVWVRSGSGDSIRKCNGSLNIFLPSDFSNLHTFATTSYIPFLALPCRCCTVCCCRQPSCTASRHSLVTTFDLRAAGLLFAPVLFSSLSFSITPVLTVVSGW